VRTGEGDGGDGLLVARECVDDLAGAHVENLDLVPASARHQAAIA